MVIKSSGVDKVAQEENREREGKRAMDSSEQHPHPRVLRSKGMFKGERGGVLRPREERFKV